jgi:hypothetical protein
MRSALLGHGSVTVRAGTPHRTLFVSLGFTGKSAQHISRRADGAANGARKRQWDGRAWESRNNRKVLDG